MLLESVDAAPRKVRHRELGSLTPPNPPNVWGLNQGGMHGIRVRVIENVSSMVKSSQPDTKDVQVSYELVKRIMSRNYLKTFDCGG